jgi:hypothetical protein
MAGVDRRHPRREQSDKGRLRPVEMKRNLMVAFGRDFSEVVIPALTRIEPETWAGLAEHHVPGAFDIFRGKGLSIVPFDARAKLKGQYRPIVVP